MVPVGSTSLSPSYSVGTQYEDRSVVGAQVVRPFSSEARSERALVVSLPKKLCMCEAPGRPGKTIGSSGARWV